MIWETSDVINAVSAGLLLVAIGVSLFIGLRSLSQTQATQKAQERERLLKELGKISEWAQNLVNFAIDRDDKLRSTKELEKHRTTGGSLKKQYSGVFSTIVDSGEMRDAFNSIDALIAFLNTQPNNANEYTKATELENRLHISVNNILIKADSARSLLLR